MEPCTPVRGDRNGCGAGEREFLLELGPSLRPRRPQLHGVVAGGMIRRRLLTVPFTGHRGIAKYRDDSFPRNRRRLRHRCATLN